MGIGATLSRTANDIVGFPPGTRTSKVNFVWIVAIVAGHEQPIIVRQLRKCAKKARFREDVGNKVCLVGARL